jgi:four helix bundle protein
MGLTRRRSSGTFIDVLRDHRKLRVWHRGCELVAETYELTDRLPPEERFGLVTQMRRAAVSIPSNIAEGASRNTDADFVRFLDISAGSCAELETHVFLVRRLGLVEGFDPAPIEGSLCDVRRMLSGLIGTLRSGER